jgi:hypothetical protein
MRSRAEITSRYAKAYVKASRKDKGRVLDEVVSVTGWSRDNARRRLTEAAKRPPGSGRQVAKEPRKPRSPKYSYDALKVLQKVWAASGGQCGKYLAASMRTQLGGLERHGELLDGVDRYSVAVRKELLSMSAASIDRYLKPAKAADQIRGVATTKPSPLLRSSIKIRKAGDEVEAEPGFFEGDTVAHCGPTLKGEFARTLNLTDVYTGWVFTRSVRNNAHVHILSALKAGVDAVPFAVTGLDFDNGTEFLNKAVIKWAATLEIFFTRSRPYKKNDQATIESKNNHLVRKYGFYYRYDTSEERRVEPALATGQRPVQLPDPDQETRRIRYRPQRPPHPALRQARHASGPTPRRQGARPRATGRTDRVPRLAQPRGHRPPDRRPASRAAQTGQRQNRTALPRQLPHRPARRPQRHPDQGQLTHPFRGRS